MEIFVEDMERSKLFYETLGFVQEASQGPNLTWMRLGGIEILLRQHSPASCDDTYGGFGPALVVYTDGLESAVAKLLAAGFEQAGCDGEDPCCPFFRDPSGNWVQLVDPGDHS